MDYYEVTIADITKEVLSSKNYESSQCVHTEKLDHFDICSPFTLSVRAVNIFGSNVNNENVESDEGSPLSDVCSCLHARGNFS